MTRDEIRGLIGGYATGSLSETDRKALFEGALDDQELFDELAREQALKELLDAPGVKTRLIGALASRRQRAGWANAWVWAATGAFAVAVIAGIVLFEKPREVQIAQVTGPPTVPESPVPATAAPPPVVSSPVIPKEAAPVIPAPTPEKMVPQTAEAEALKAEPPPAPVPAPAAPRQTNAPAAVGTLGGVSAGDVAAGGGGGGGGRGGGRGGAAVGAVGGANRAAAQSFAALAAKPAGFSFNYSVTPEGLLRIVPASNGFLTVSANNGTTMSAVFGRRPLQAGAVTDIPLPPDCVSALVIFSAQEMPAGLASVISSTLDSSSGTKSDPNPSPDSVLIAVVPVKR